VILSCWGCAAAAESTTLESSLFSPVAHFPTSLVAQHHTSPSRHRFPYSAEHNTNALMQSLAVSHLIRCCLCTLETQPCWPQMSTTTEDEATTESGNGEITQYVRYKTGVVQDRDTKVSLREVNTEVHRRVLREERDRLCDHCAYFDFTRIRRCSTTSNHSKWPITEAANDTNVVSISDEFPLWTWTIKTDRQYRCRLCDLLVDLFQ
jgi:hypothetical protein